MKIITLGKTNLKVNKNGFGALPIQRISEKEAVYLLHKAYENGFNFFDTARFYTDSEEKIGAAFADRRSKVIIASKTGATTVEDFWKDLHTTLKNLKPALFSSVTVCHSPSNVAAPFNTACISAPVQRFTFGSHSTFGLPSTISMDTMRKSFVESVKSIRYAPTKLRRN